MWIIVTEEEQKRSREFMEKQLEEASKRAEERRKAIEAHEACKCPHCGRNDPLPPWLQY